MLALQVLCCGFAAVLHTVLASPQLHSRSHCNTTQPVEAYAEREYFYAGGQYVNATLPNSNTSSQYMVGQIYVERLVPYEVKHTYPLLFIAGNAQTGTNWLNTPDSRPGWASYFLQHGYIVYLTDQFLRGRSPWLPIPGGPYSGNLSAYSTQQITSLFTAPESSVPLPYPQAVNHSQWPGTGLPGDSIFDAFYASQVQLEANATLLAGFNNHSYTALVDRITDPEIGTADGVVVVTHSQAGPFGWKLGDERPDQVKGIVALEPEGPPFDNWAAPPFRPGYTTPGEGRPYGITAIPVAYDPPISNASQLQRTTVPAINNESAACERQVEPARHLVNLAKVPVLMVTSEASYHVVYDYCTAAYLHQAGVNVNYTRLPEVGIHGNGHFIFMEKNNLEVAERVIEPWIEKIEGAGREVCGYRA